MEKRYVVVVRAGSYLDDLEICVDANSDPTEQALIEVRETFGRGATVERVIEMVNVVMVGGWLDV